MDRNKGILTLATYMLSRNAKPNETFVDIYEDWRRHSGIVLSDAQGAEYILQSLCAVRDFPENVLCSLFKYGCKRYRHA